MAKSEYSKMVEKFNAQQAQMATCPCGASVPIKMFDKYSGRCPSCFEAYCDGAHEDMNRRPAFDTVTQAEMRKHVRGKLSAKQHLPGTPIEDIDQHAQNIEAAKREQARAVAAYARRNGIELRRQE